MSTAEEILSAPDRPWKDTIAWGKELRLMPMGGADRDEYDLERYRAMNDGQTLGYWRARYLVRCLYDREGNRVFTAEQAKPLSEKNGEILKRLWDELEELNGLGQGAVSAAAKNSSGEASDTTGSASRAN
jgi:hypothetical protein